MSESPDQKAEPTRWAEFQRGSIDAYKAYLAGYPELLVHHNLLEGGHQELNFVVRLSQLFFGSVPHGRALDVGCGWGYMTSCLKDLGYEATGFDLSEDAIQVAQRQFMGVRYFQGDGAEPKRYFGGQEFDLILVREFHPFTRIDDPEFQLRIIRDYLDMLRDDGLMVIAHGRRGQHLDYRRVRLDLKHSAVKTAGPFYFSLMKRLKIPAANKGIIRAASIANELASLLLRKKYVEFFLLHKSNAQRCVSIAI